MIEALAEEGEDGAGGESQATELSGGIVQDMQGLLAHGGRWRNHHRTPSAPKFDESLVPQDLIGVEDGMQADAQGCTECFGSRKPFPVAEGPVQDALADRSRYLLVQGIIGGGVQSDQHALTLLL